MVTLLVFLVGFAILGALSKPSGFTNVVVAVLSVALTATLWFTGRV